MRYLKAKQPKNTTNKAVTNNLRNVAQIEANLSAVITARNQKEKAAANAALKKRCDDLAKNEAQAWQEINDEYDRKVGSGYDQATKLLVSLKELAVYRGTLAEFETKLKLVLQKYGKSKAFLQRLQKVGLGVL